MAEPSSGEVLDAKLYAWRSIEMKAGNAYAIKALDVLLEARFRPKGDVFIEDAVVEEKMNHTEDAQSRENHHPN